MIGKAIVLYLNPLVEMPGDLELLLSFIEHQVKLIREGK
jgi:hypothetical protein